MEDLSTQHLHQQQMSGPQVSCGFFWKKPPQTHNPDAFSPKAHRHSTPKNLLVGRRYGILSLVLALLFSGGSEAVRFTEDISSHCPSAAPTKCKWYGGLMGADGCIYGIPNCANSVSWLSNERACFAALGCMRFVLSSSLFLIIYSAQMLYV